MSYIKDNLMPNEKILYTAQVSPMIFLAPTIVFVFTIFYIIIYTTSKDIGTQIINGGMTIILFLLTIKLTFETAIIMLTTEFAITNKRVVAKRGFIHRNTLEILLPKIESVNVYQNILGRLLNFGTVTVTGTGGTKESFKAIIDPTTVRKKINQIIEHFSQSQNTATGK